MKGTKSKTQWANQGSHLHVREENAQSLVLHLFRGLFILVLVYSWL
jgi:hypothetical protein